MQKDCQRKSTRLGQTRTYSVSASPGLLTYYNYLCIITHGAIVFHQKYFICQINRCNISLIHSLLHIYQSITLNCHQNFFFNVALFNCNFFVFSWVCETSNIYFSYQLSTTQNISINENKYDISTEHIGIINMTVDDERKEGEEW